MSSAADDIVTVYAVFADRGEAEAIGRAMIERNFAACVNMLAPCTSIYRWNDRIETAQEVPALFKVAADRAARLVHEIAAMHRYDCPAIVVWPIQQAHEIYKRYIID